MSTTSGPISVSRRGFLRSAVAGTAVAGAAGTASAQETHTVEMTDDLVFDPDSITIAAGDTVVWENVGTIGHSVTAYGDSIPDGADYFASGDFDSEEAARDGYPQGGDVAGGESYGHTFENPGSYDYFCVPHEGVGMVGTVEVTPSGGSGGPGDGTPSGPLAGEPIIPGGSPVTLAVVVGTAALAVLSTAYSLAGQDVAE